ncbi:MAG: helix-turn-helix domain-containing protein [Bacillota bacterium]|nr:helix-turn-helix domain-containing protein [Bacillota bacterium]MDW7678126.1 helix-turn-helix domain-containing protein [Bacillota bacterium]
MNLFAERLRKIRKEMGLTQEDLADGIGISTSTIISYEKGKTHPKYHRARRLEEYLGVSIDWLCGMDVEEPEMIEVPLYRIPAPGTPLLRETNLLGTASVILHYGVSQCLLVKDDSMAGFGIRKGDQVGFRRQEWLRTGDIAVVDVKGKGVLIRRVKIEDDGRMQLIPHWEGRPHPWKDAEVIETDKDGKLAGCRIIGKVIRG